MFVSYMIPNACKHKDNFRNFVRNINRFLSCLWSRVNGKCRKHSIHLSCTDVIRHAKPTEQFGLIFCAARLCKWKMKLEHMAFVPLVLLAAVMECKYHTFTHVWCKKKNLVNLLPIAKFKWPYEIAMSSYKIQGLIHLWAIHHLLYLRGRCVAPGHVKLRLLFCHVVP